MKKISTVAVQQSRNVSQPQLTIGLDLGDRSSWYCVLDEAGTIVLEQKLGTTERIHLEEERVMPIKRYKPEQIVTMLRQIEVSIANGKPTKPVKKPRSRCRPSTAGGGQRCTEDGPGEATRGTGERGTADEAAGGGAVAG